MATATRRAIGTRSEDEFEQTVEALAAFLRAELFAVETYNAALGKVTCPVLRAELAALRDSHQQRAELLRERLLELGQPAVQAVEPWGAFANAFRRVACAPDDGTTLAALREGENWGVRDYEIDLDELADELRQEIASRVLPEQRLTCERVHSLRQRR